MKRLQVCGWFLSLVSALFSFSAVAATTHRLTVITKGSETMLNSTSPCSGSNVVTVCDEAHLRQAIALGGTVRFCCNGTITLANTIDVTNSVELDGNGYDVVISGGNAVRIFSVRTNSALAVRHLWLANGRHVGTNGANAGTSGQPAQPGEDGVGGAICNRGGTVSLFACVLSNNWALGGLGGADQVNLASGSGGSGRGGAVFNRGGILSFDSVMAFSNSVAGGYGGRIELGGTNGPSLGGALSSVGGFVFITNSLFAGNYATGRYPPYGFSSPASGGALEVENSLLVIARTAFVANRAVGENHPQVLIGPQNRPSSAYGGALFIQSGTSFVNRCQFSTNSAQGGNGFRSSGTGEARGGAIYSLGTLWIGDTSLSTNQAVAGGGSDVNGSGQGGGLYNGGTGYVDGTTFDRNLAQGGTAGSFAFIHAAFPGGDGNGGAIFNAGALASTNCTFALNQVVAGGTSASALTNAGLVGGTAYGGAIHNAGGTLVMMDVTIASNSVVEGHRSPPSLGANIVNTNGSFSLRNSLVAYGIGASNVWGTITDGGFNMSSDGSCNFSSGSSFNSTDPKLGPLADYGGPTLTMALQSDSPAIDFGTTAGAPSTDQRGFQRPFGTGVDMGAYEVGPPAPSLTWQRNGSTLEISFMADAGVSYELIRSTDLVSWQLQELIPATTTSQVVSRFIMMTETRQFFRLRAE